MAHFLKLGSLNGFFPHRVDRRSDNATSVDVEIDPHWTLVFGGCSFPPVSYIYMFILSLGPAGDCPGLRGSWSAVTVGVRIPWYLRRAVGVRIPWYFKLAFQGSFGGIRPSVANAVPRSAKSGPKLRRDLIVGIGPGATNLSDW